MQLALRRVRQNRRPDWLGLAHHDGISVPRSQTLAETSRCLKERLDLDATPLTDRVEAVLFGGRPADERDIADLVRLRAELRRRLRARAGWAASLRVRYGLRVAPR